MSASGQALEELIATSRPSDVPAAVDELRAIEKQGSAIVALIPFVGLWFLYRSDTHPPADKSRLVLTSLGTTLLTVVIIWSILPASVDEGVRLHTRARADLQVLADFAEAYRKENHRYPDEATWRRFAEQADPRFFDPWARPYLYEQADRGIRIFTRGRDALDGGRGQDEDLELSVESSAEP